MLTLQPLVFVYSFASSPTKLLSHLPTPHPASPTSLLLPSRDFSCLFLPCPALALPCSVLPFHSFPILPLHRDSFDTSRATWFRWSTILTQKTTMLRNSSRIFSSIATNKQRAAARVGYSGLAKHSNWNTLTNTRRGGLTLFKAGHGLCRVSVATSTHYSNVQIRSLSSKAGAEEHEFQAETRKLLDIVTNSIYTDKEVFVRELVSNASDALEKYRYRQTTGEVQGDEKPLEITIDINEEMKTITIGDNGIGMSKQELMENLGTIARSGSKRFVESLEGGESSSTDIIGQFGVGFYSSFMVAETVTVESAPASLVSHVPILQIPLNSSCFLYPHFVHRLVVQMLLSPCSGLPMVLVSILYQKVFQRLPQMSLYKRLSLHFLGEAELPCMSKKTAPNFSIQKGLKT